MPTIEWIGQSRKDDDAGQMNPARLLNCYRELTPAPVIKAVLGLQPFVAISGIFMRAMKEVAGSLYVVHGGEALQITEGGGGIDLGALTDDANTTISGNNGKVCFVAGGNYSVWDGSAWSTPTTGAITNIGSVTFLGQRTILTEKAGRRVQWSDVADATTFDALEFGTAESRDDNIIRGEAIGDQLWIFGERSVEQWGLTGTDSVLAQMPGQTMDVGLKAFGLLTLAPNAGFFVGSDNIAYLVSGGGAKPVSTRSIETAIYRGEPTHCFYYEDEGHKFCVIRFADRPAWVYDMSADEWHERADGQGLDNWSVVAIAAAYGKQAAGTEEGLIHSLERVNTDNGAPLVRKAVSQVLEVEADHFTIDRLQVFPEVGRSSLGYNSAEALGVGTGNAAGVGDNTGLGTGVIGSGPYDAKIMFRVSRDRGETWGLTKTRSLGGQGEYRRRVILNALGVFQSATVEFTISDPIEAPMRASAKVQIT